MSDLQSQVPVRDSLQIFKKIFAGGVAQAVRSPD
jgi:hypothetical protein